MTPNGTKTWQYDDYETVGPTENGKRVFQSLTLVQSGQPSAEQLQYAFNTHGGLRSAVFAQTPASGFTPSSGNPWYDATHLASVRARTWYAYDAEGRSLSCQTYWDTWNSGSSSYSSTAVLDNECAYELTGLNRGLKTSSSFYTGSGVNWTLNHTETYAYDPNLDYLTGASYGDGLPNATPTWSYDAAGNRTNTVADNLNRPITINGVSSTSDILGNRLALGSQSYGWDCLNRMTSYGSTNSYVYRADGSRVSKQVGSTATKYFYDGQMGVEDQDTTSGVSTITDYGLGARGVDYISRLASGVTTNGFPLYDGHGNMTACLFRSGTSSYTLANQRSYDAWGVVRQGVATGDPKGRYCATLGHKQDDESGLVYMRARFYDAPSGRFLSEDPRFYGPTLFAFCQCDPVNYSDQTGKSPSFSQLFWGILGGTVGVCGAGLGCAGAAVTGSTLLMLGIGVLMQLGPAGVTMATTIVDSLTPAAISGIGLAAVLACAAYCAVCAVLCYWDDTFDMNEAYGSGG